MIFDWKTLCYQQLISRSELESSVNPELIFENTIDGIIVRIKTKILSEDLAPKEIHRTKVVEFRQPQTWWDMFKNTYTNTWWFGWFVRRYPPKMVPIFRSVTFNVRLQPTLLFPQSVTLPKDVGRPIRFYDFTEVMTEDV
jgi:hypothetical protein